MNLTNDIELANTRAKLERLEAHYDARRNEPVGDETLRALSLRSVKRTIDQLKEEIARYEAHQPARR